MSDPSPNRNRNLNPNPHLHLHLHPNANPNPDFDYGEMDWAGYIKSDGYKERWLHIGRLLYVDRLMYSYLSGGRSGGRSGVRSGASDVSFVPPSFVSSGGRFQKVLIIYLEFPNVGGRAFSE